MAGSILHICFLKRDRKHSNLIQALNVYSTYWSRLFICGRHPILPFWDALCLFGPLVPSIKGREERVWFETRYRFGSRTVGAIVESEGKYLLKRRKSGDWVLPEGKKFKRVLRSFGGSESVQGGGRRIKIK